jgi:N-methylhydantoinase A
MRISLTMAGVPGTSVDIRLAVDVGGTFTDLIVETPDGRVGPCKSPTTPDDPVRGVLNVLDVAADDLGIDRSMLLGRCSLFVHGTTRSTNAIINGDVARTALLVTKGHPDVLLWREGSRVDTFDFSASYPEPYVSRQLTFEVPERIGAGGEVVTPLDEEAVAAIAGELVRREVQAVAVCLLWSVVNGAHELRVGEILRDLLRGVPFTLSHRLTAAVREYRRASASSIDASLKPLMGAYLGSLDVRLRESGFNGRTLVVTSAGGVLDAQEVAETPIHSLGSGPAAAPVAGRLYAQVDAGTDTAIVTDAGGTSYDVSLVRRGMIPWTRETTVGDSSYGHMTGFASVDVTSIGAGGGSIAWVDDGGLLHVGPQSAGAVPGPVCYGQGGMRPTVTDASLVVGYLDPEFFLGGRVKLDREAARGAIAEQVGMPLGMTEHEAAAAILELATEHMVGAIEQITLKQGVDPSSAVIVAGGGSGGFYAVAIASRLGVERVIIPDTAAALSAMGAMLSDLTAEYSVTVPTSTADFRFDAVNATLAHLGSSCRDFIAGPGRGSIGHEVVYSAEARYPEQVWEVEVPLRRDRLQSQQDIEELQADFDAVHEELFSFADRGSDVEIITWRARVRCHLRDTELSRPSSANGNRPDQRRAVYFAETGLVEVPVRSLDRVREGTTIEGPAVLESSLTTIVIDPGAHAVLSHSGSVIAVPPRKRR